MKNRYQKAMVRALAMEMEGVLASSVAQESQIASSGQKTLIPQQIT